MGLNLAHSWWLLMLRGFLAVLFGILAFLWPAVTLHVLVLMFGVYALLDGICSLAAALPRRRQGHPSWPLILEGLTGIGAGLATLFWPGITARGLLYLVGIWALLTGIFELLAANRLRQQVAGIFVLDLAGALSVLFGLFVIVFPAAAALALVWVIAGCVLAFGVFLLVLAGQLWQLSRRYASPRSWWHSFF